jgi:thioredoxin reductase (NADPH)
LNKGISSCATCDGYFYRDQKILIVGGGNVAVGDALYLSNIASHVTLIHRRDKLSAEERLVEQVMKKTETGIVAIKWNTELVEVLGDGNNVTGVKIKNNKTNEIETLDVTGIFIAIGHSPNTKIFEGQLDLSKGYILIKGGFGGNFTETSVSGVFAAGDVAEYAYQQAITAAALGCMAALDVEKYLNSL